MASKTSITTNRSYTLHVHDIIQLACKQRSPLLVLPLQALEQNYITFKALSMGAGSGGQQQQQQSDASIAALGGSEAAAAAMEISDGEDSDGDDVMQIGEQFCRTSLLTVKLPRLEAHLLLA